MDPTKTGAANANQERNQEAPATPTRDVEMTAPQPAFRLVDLLEIEEADCLDRSFVVSDGYEEKLNREITQLEEELHEALFGKQEEDDASSIWDKDVKSINWFVPKEQVLTHIENEMNGREDRDTNDILQHNAMLRLYLQVHPGARMPKHRCKYSYDETTQIPSLEKLAEIREEIDSRLVKMWKAEISRNFVLDCSLYARNSCYANTIDETEAADAAVDSFPLRRPWSNGGTPDRDEEVVREEALYYHPDFVYSPRSSPINDDSDNEGYSSDDLLSNIVLPEAYYEQLPEFLSPEHRADGYGPWDYDEPQDGARRARDDDDRSIFDLIEGVHFVNVGNEEYRFPAWDGEEQDDTEPMHEPNGDQYEQRDELDDELMEIQRGLADVVRPVRINGLGCVVHLPVTMLRMYENGHPIVAVEQSHPLVANMIQMLGFPHGPDGYRAQDGEHVLDEAAQDETEDGPAGHEEHAICSEYDRLFECKPSSSVGTEPVQHDDDNNGAPEVTYKRPCEETQCDGPSPKKWKANLQLNWQKIRNLTLTRAEYLRDIGMYKIVCPPNQYRTNQSTSARPAGTTADRAILEDDHVGWYNRQMADYGHLLRTGSEDLSLVNIGYMDSLLADNDKQEELTPDDDDKTYSDMEID